MMPCTTCGADTFVTETRSLSMNGKIALRRRRKCSACDKKQTTYERTVDIRSPAERENIIVPRAIVTASLRIIEAASEMHDLLVGAGLGRQEPTETEGTEI